MQVLRPVRPLLVLIAALSACSAAAGEHCPPPRGVALQVLGSGGPIADDARASAGYLVWIDGRARLLIDAGGGTFLRFGEAGARFADLDVVGLSHFHTDHSADFAALLKSGYFSGRQRPLTVIGPDADRPFPGLHDYLSSLLAADSGAYAYLAGYVDGSGGLVRLEPLEVAADGAEPALLYRNEERDLEVYARHVPHGIVPALAFRVSVGKRVMTFAGDQNGSDDSFADFAKDSDVLVMHLPIPESASGGAVQLHARPGRVGELAARSNAKTLVLSHFMARSLRNLERNVALVADRFDGTIVTAEDLGCLTVGD